jgi:hypothetical protein
VIGCYSNNSELLFVNINHVTFEGDSLVEHYPNVGFTKCKIKRVVNLFEDTGNVRELNYLAKISRSCFSPNGRIKASSIINYVQMFSLTL